MSELRSSEQVLDHDCCYQNAGATLLGTFFMSSLHLPKCRSCAPGNIFYVVATSTIMSELRSSEHLLCLCYVYQNVGATLLRTSFMSLLHLPKYRSYAPQNLFYVFATSTKMSELCSWGGSGCCDYWFGGLGMVTGRRWFFCCISR